MRVRRHSNGSVRYDKRRKTWIYLWYDGPVRRSKRSGTKHKFPTKAAAWIEVERLGLHASEELSGDTVQSLIERYEKERMPARQSTARVYRSFLRNHILPEWGGQDSSGITASPC